VLQKCLQQQLPARLGFRFFQLVMAVALKQALLPNLTSKPTAYDPDYDRFDHALLGQLGFRALQEQPSYDVAGSGAALLYMPCCPRELYAAVLVSCVPVAQCCVTGLIYACMLLLPESFGQSVTASVDTILPAIYAAAWCVVLCCTFLYDPAQLHDEGSLDADQQPLCHNMGQLQLVTPLAMRVSLLLCHACRQRTTVTCSSCPSLAPPCAPWQTRKH
jgi:hypothetical protein